MSPRPDLGSWPHLGYAASRIERVAEKRTDADALRALEADAAARWYVVGGELVAHAQDGGGPRSAVRARRGAGARRRGAHRLSRPHGRRAAVRAGDRAGGDGSAQGARRIRSLRSAHHRGARHGRRTSICRRWPKASRCWSGIRGGGSAPIAAAETRSVEAGWRRDCPTCKMQHFPRTDPVVIMLAIDGERCLLGRSGRFADQFLVVPCGLRRARRDHRGRGAARSPRGSRHRLRTGEIFPLAALAVPVVADDRLPCAGAVARPRRRSQRARGRALVRPRGGGARCWRASIRRD